MEITMYNSREVKKEISSLYKQFPEVKRLLHSFGCDPITAEDIFQEALIIYLKKKNDSKFEFQLEPIHFIKQTCKFLWFNQARKEQKQTIEVAEDNFSDSCSAQWMEKELLYKQLESALTKIGERCRKLLHLFYGLGWNMIDIAKKLDFRSDKVAKAQKYRCIQKAKELVLQESKNVSSIEF